MDIEPRQTVSDYKKIVRTSYLHIMIRTLSLLSLILCTMSLLGCADTEAINELCYKKYPDSVISRLNCIRIENKEAPIRAAEKRKKEEREKAKREEQREQKELERYRAEKEKLCVENIIADMETQVRNITETTYTASSLEDFRSQWPSSKIMKKDADITQRVLVITVEAEDYGCNNSSFYFLINVDETTSGDIRQFRVWARNPPNGYPEGYLSKFHIDMERIRNDALKEKRQQENERKLITSNPCKPGLNKQQRLRLLADWGQIQQTGTEEYQAGTYGAGFKLAYFSGTGRFWYCEPL